MERAGSCQYLDTIYRKTDPHVLSAAYHHSMKHDQILNFCTWLSNELNSAKLAANSEVGKVQYNFGRTTCPIPKFLCNAEQVKKYKCNKLNWWQSNI